MHPLAMLVKHLSLQDMLMGFVFQAACVRDGGPCAPVAPWAQLAPDDKWICKHRALAAKICFCEAPGPSSASFRSQVAPSNLWFLGQNLQPCLQIVA